MASIIDHTYFVGDISIPDAAPGKPVGENLDWHISTYESFFLTEILGHQLYKQFHGDIQGDPISVPYSKLLNGFSFTDSLGRKNYWCGFKGSQIGADYKFSPIANYVYWQRMRQNSTQTVGVGVVVPLSENEIVVSPSHKMVRAWNKMVDWNWIMHDFILSNKADYPEYIGLDFPPYLLPPNNARLLGNQQLFVKQNVFGL